MSELMNKEKKMNAMSTHRTRYVTVFIRPAWGASTGSTDGVASCPIGTLTRLIAAQSPSSTGARDGAVDTLPTCSDDRSF